MCLTALSLKKQVILIFLMVSETTLDESQFIIEGFAYLIECTKTLKVEELSYLLERTFPQN